MAIMNGQCRYQDLFDKTVPVLRKMNFEARLTRSYSYPMTNKRLILTFSNVTLFTISCCQAAGKGLVTYVLNINIPISAVDDSSVKNELRKETFFVKQSFSTD